VPRFYFHLYNDRDVRDEEGVELLNLEAARRHAVHLARFTFGETARDEGRVVLHHRIDVGNDQGVVLASVRFGDAVKVEE
jgi:hypothetical protein